MFIICQYFLHGDPARAAELEFCLRDNMKSGNRLILFEEHPAPDDIRRGATQCIPYPQRLTYGNALKWANQNLPAGSIVAVINLDIMIRFAHAAVHEHLQRYPNHFLCLSRLEYDPAMGAVGVNATLEKHQYMNCQDAWVFRTPVPELALSDFSIGNCPGCDSAIAYRAAEAGLLPVNLAGTFPIWHYDLAREKHPGTLMTKDSTTSLLCPEKHGRLFLPRIAVGGGLNYSQILAFSKAYVLEVVEKSGYSRESDAMMSSYLACNYMLRFVPAGWDLRYLIGCIAINNVTVLNNTQACF